MRVLSSGLFSDFWERFEQIVRPSGSGDSKIGTFELDSFHSVSLGVWTARTE